MWGGRDSRVRAGETTRHGTSLDKCIPMPMPDAFAYSNQTRERGIGDSSPF